MAMIQWLLCVAVAMMASTTYVDAYVKPIIDHIYPQTMGRLGGWLTISGYNLLAIAQAPGKVLMCSAKNGVDLPTRTAYTVTDLDSVYCPIGPGQIGGTPDANGIHTAILYIWAADDYAGTITGYASVSQNDNLYPQVNWVYSAPWNALNNRDSAMQTYSCRGTGSFLWITGQYLGLGPSDGLSVWDYFAFGSPAYLVIQPQYMRNVAGWVETGIYRDNGFGQKERIEIISTSTPDFCGGGPVKCFPSPEGVNGPPTLTYLGFQQGGYVVNDNQHIAPMPGSDPQWYLNQDMAQVQSCS